MSTEINRAETAVRKSSEGRRAPLLSVSIYFLIITQICCVIIIERRQMPIALFAQGSSPWQAITDEYLKLSLTEIDCQGHLRCLHKVHPILFRWPRSRMLKAHQTTEG